MKKKSCKKCNHNQGDHAIVQHQEKGIVLVFYYGECQFNFCECEKFEQ